MLPVYNTDGEDISSIICEAASSVGLDPVWLLALIKAESNLKPRAARWGFWPDVSFGYSQCIVLYHYYGDHTNTDENIYAVMDYVFDHPAEDIRQSGIRLAANISRSLDGTPLGGMVVYNAGSDRRNDPDWMQKWAGNVASYEWAIEWAETYRRSDK